jgi:PleD family two-component response regulator
MELIHSVQKTDKYKGLRVLLGLKKCVFSEKLIAILQNGNASNVKIVENHKDAMQEMHKLRFNMFVLHKEFPDLGGIDFGKFIRLTNSPMARAPIILATSLPSEKLAITVRDAGINMLSVIKDDPLYLANKIETARRVTKPFIDTAEYKGPCRRHQRRGEIPVDIIRQTLI